MAIILLPSQIALSMIKQRVAMKAQVARLRAEGVIEVRHLLTLIKPYSQLGMYAILRRHTARTFVVRELVNEVKRLRTEQPQITPVFIGGISDYVH